MTHLPNADEFSLKSRLIVSDEGLTHPPRKMICWCISETHATMTTPESFLCSLDVRFFFGFSCVNVGILAAAFWREPPINVLPGEQRRA